MVWPDANRSLTDLSSLDSLSSAHQNTLLSYSIGTVEELAGTLAADPPGVQSLLGLDNAGFEVLRSEVQGVLSQDPALVAEFERQRLQTYSLGALEPGAT